MLIFPIAFFILETVMKSLHYTVESWKIYLYCDWLGTGCSGKAFYIVKHMHGNSIQKLISFDWKINSRKGTEHLHSMNWITSAWGFYYSVLDTGMQEISKSSYFITKSELLSFYESNTSRASVKSARDCPTRHFNSYYFTHCDIARASELSLTLLSCAEQTLCLKLCSVLT